MLIVLPAFLTHQRSNHDNVLGYRYEDKTPSFTIFPSQQGVFTEVARLLKLLPISLAVQYVARGDTKTDSAK